jgi:hypothetical protein
VDAEEVAGDLGGDKVVIVNDDRQEMTAVGDAGLGRHLVRQSAPQIDDPDAGEVEAADRDAVVSLTFKVVDLAAVREPRFPE